MEPWAAIAFAKDWYPGARLQNAPSWHYVHTDQWRYEKDFTDYHTVPQGRRQAAGRGHTMDHAGPRGAQRLAAVLSPVQPQPAGRWSREAEAAGREDDADRRQHVVEQLKIEAS
jgi:nitrate reductase / nitrite oxidoreductase, alpha subunit